MKRSLAWTLLAAFAGTAGGCGGAVPFAVEALYRPRSNAFEDVRVYAEGMKPPGATARQTNVTVLLRTREGTGRVLRLATRDGRPFVAEDVPGTLLRRGLPLDADLLRHWLPEPPEEGSEEHLRGEAEELLEAVTAAAGGRRADLPPTTHLIPILLR